MPTPDPSPTEEELATILHRVVSTEPDEKGFSYHELGCHVQNLIAALRSARESARVATRGRDELFNEGFSLSAELEHERQRVTKAEAQLTDSDRMIAGLSDALQDIDDGLASIAPDDDPGDLLDALRFARADAKKALSTSHPIAAEYEAQIARERDELQRELNNRCRCDFSNRTTAEIVAETRPRAECGFHLGIYDRAERAMEQLHAHEETIGRLQVALDELQDHHCSGFCPTGHAEVMKRTNDALAAAPLGEYEQRVRREALEEAAKLVEGNAWKMSTRFEDAAAIRALASKDDANPAGK